MANESGGNTQNNQPGDFNARLQFLLQSSESLHASLQELHTQIAERDKKVDARFDKLLTAAESLLAIARRHEDRLDKLDPGGKQ
jgi:hypothetical protein